MRSVEALEFKWKRKDTSTSDIYIMQPSILSWLNFAAKTFGTIIYSHVSQRIYNKKKVWPNVEGIPLVHLGSDMICRRWYKCCLVHYFTHNAPVCNTLDLLSHIVYIWRVWSWTLGSHWDLSDIHCPLWYDVILWNKSNNANDCSTALHDQWMSKSFHGLRFPSHAACMQVVSFIWPWH